MLLGAQIGHGGLLERLDCWVLRGEAVLALTHVTGWGAGLHVAVTLLPPALGLDGDQVK